MESSIPVVTRSVCELQNSGYHSSEITLVIVVVQSFSKGGRIGKTKARIVACGSRRRGKEKWTGNEQKISDKNDRK